MTAKGRFITLEGGEGVGKSTLAASLASRLGERGLKTIRTREPGGSPGAEALRRLILTPPPELDAWGPVTEALMFYAARRDHLDKLIRPALASGAWVICDRFSDSTRAYQAAAGGAVREEIEALEKIVVGPAGPDLTLILDLPLNAARARMTARNTVDDAIESRGPEYHERVRQAFLDIARNHPQRCAVIDASMPAEAVADAAMKIIDQRIAMPAAGGG